MNLAGVGEAFADTVTGGPLVLAALVAAAAGLVSFLSPCVLPLVPGYLSYVTGLAGADATDRTVGRADAAGVAGVAETTGTGAVAVASRPATRPHRSRTLLGVLLFVLGFTAVFVLSGTLFGGIGATLIRHQDVITRVLGAVIIVFGLAFCDLVPFLRREVRVHRLPRAGLAGAPILGVTFGLGWIPCIGPTLGAVLSLSYSTGSAGRGAFLAAAYCLGLGIPFILAGTGFRWALGAFAALRRHTVWVQRIGGGMLIVMGVLLVSGLWNDLSIWLRAWLGQIGATSTSI